MTKTEYSIGFLHNDHTVALVRKNRPEWQNGLLNGIGGHIEKGETPGDAMEREFEEETGVFVARWEYFLKLEGPNSVIHCFAKNDNGEFLKRLRTTTDEEIGLWYFHELNNRNKPGSLTVPNLKWIVPLMRQRGNYEAAIVDFVGGS